MAVIDELVALLGFDLKGEENVKKFGKSLDDSEKKARDHERLAERRAMIARRREDRLAAMSDKLRRRREHADESAAKRRARHDALVVRSAAINAKAARNSAMIASGVKVAVGAISGIAVGAAVKASIVSFAEFDRKMTRVGITAGATKTEVVNAGKEVQQLAQKYALPIGDAVEGLETLVASGMDLREAMNFLPSSLATAQASGAAVVDVAKTAIKTSSALKIAAKDMQQAFDVMVAGGDAGEFELKNMASYIPNLANSFATLGYKGQSGLKYLIALLQTLLDSAGSAGDAATQAGNIFGKIYSGETANAFKKMGMNLPLELKKATDAGEDTITAFIRLSNKALKGDMTKLPLLFTDQEFRLGMQTLLTSGEKFKEFMDAVNSSAVDGTVMRHNSKLLDDTKASTDRLATSWERLLAAFGGTLAPAAVPAMDAITDTLTQGIENREKALNYEEALEKQFDKEGLTHWERKYWLLTNPSQAAMDEKARLGGYKFEHDRPGMADDYGFGGYGFGSADGMAPVKTPDGLVPLYNWGDPDKNRIAPSLPGDIGFGYELPGALGAGPTSPAERRQRMTPESYRRSLAERDQFQYGGLLPLDTGQNFTLGAERLNIPEATIQKAVLATDGTPMPQPRPAYLAYNDQLNAKMSDAGAAASITNDNRVSNTNVTVSAPISMTVQQPTQAPAAVAGAVQGAVTKAGQLAPTRLQAGPVQ